MQESTDPLEQALAVYDRATVEEHLAAIATNAGQKRIEYKAAWSYADRAL